ncbi:hypothetical protein ALT1000_70014 [Alteromonas macleodii]
MPTGRHSVAGPLGVALFTPTESKVYYQLLKFGAGNEIRTRDPDLGKVVLYQLSYSRNKRGTSFEVVRILQKFWGNATFNSTFFAPQCLNA